MKHVYSIILLWFFVFGVQAQDTTFHYRLRLSSSAPDFPVELGISRNITPTLLLDLGLGVVMEKQIQTFAGNFRMSNAVPTKQHASVSLDASAFFIRSGIMKRIIPSRHEEINMGVFYSLSVSNQKMFMEVYDPFFGNDEIKKSNIYNYHLIGTSVQYHIILNPTKSLCLNLGLNWFMSLNKPEVFEEMIGGLGEASGYIPGYGYHDFPVNFNFGLSYLLLK